MKKDNKVETAVDSRKLYDSCIKVRPQPPNMNNLLSRISAKKTKRWRRNMDIEKWSRKRVWTISLTNKLANIVLAPTSGETILLVKFQGWNLRTNRRTHDFPRENWTDWRTTDTGRAVERQKFARTKRSGLKPIIKRRNTTQNGKKPKQ